MNKGIVVVLAGLLLTFSAMGALMAEKMQVTKVCKDVRVAMDGAIDAVVETGGLTSAKTMVTLFRHHNRQKIKMDSIEVRPYRDSSGVDTYAGENVQLRVASQINPKTGRQPASLQGEVNGERFQIPLGCMK
jgi:hypothetical protein